MSSCPSCGSNNTKTQQLVWMSGSRRGKSGFGGVSISNRGRITVGGGRGRSSSQSNLAASCAPPKRGMTLRTKSALVAFGVFVVIFMILINIFPDYIFNSESFFGKLLFLSAIVASVFAARKYYVNNKGNENNLLQEYANSWICLKCGCKFNPVRANESSRLANELTKDLKNMLAERERDRHGK
ncbi:DUF4199 domain-containing protein [Acinetobacter colistiniresistens]|uniref:DUF4199 domain-containing protein n=1 Tax=Acinetobacter colistiniresistens TaxID=280145 RepID=UPI000E5C3EF7|nr:DUF4199 domain-containing protein [Acinetobacter colistiniresistens]